MKSNVDRLFTDRQRRIFINVAKGIAIFLMLWGHCIQVCSTGAFDFFENSVFKVLYSFHMPLFMLISGYLFFFSFQKRNLKELLVHRTQAMLQPIFMCGILSFLLVDVLFGVLNGKYTTILGGGWLNHLQDFWFLWSVLSASIAVTVCCKITDRIWLQFIYLIIGAVFVSMMPCMESNVYMYPYFVIGFLFGKFEKSKWMEIAQKFKYLSLLLFPIMILFYKKDHYIYTSGLTGTEGLIRHMPINLFRWAIGLVGSIFMLTILEICFKHIVIKGRLLRTTHLFGKLGEKSLQIYTISCIFLSQYLLVAYGKFVKLAGGNIFADNMIIYNFVFTFLLAIAYSLGLMMIIRLLEKYKVSKLLFGK